MKKILFLIVLPLLLVGLDACLDNKGYTDIIDSVNKRPVVSLFGRENGVVGSAIEVSENETVTATVTVANASSDLAVTFKIDQTLLDDYNQQVIDEAVAAGDSLADGTPDFDVIDLFDILPDTVYTIPSLTVNVPNGTLDADLVVNVNSAKMSLTDNYILPLIIESVSGDPNAVISTNNNLNNILLYVQVKNRFDGKYEVTGTIEDKQAPTIDGSCAFPYNVYLITNGGNQSNVYDVDNGYYHLICSGGAQSIYGNVGVVFNFDSNNNVISVVNYYIDPLPRGRTLQLDPSGENKWDPTTKTLKVKYWLNQANGTQPHRTYFDETYTYKGPRP